MLQNIDYIESNDISNAQDNGLLLYKSIAQLEIPKLASCVLQKILHFGVCWSTDTELAQYFGVTRQAINKTINSLCNSGLVTKTRDDNKRQLHSDFSYVKTEYIWIEPTIFQRTDISFDNRILSTLVGALSGAGNNYLSNYMGCTVRRIQANLQTIENAGYITRLREGRRRRIEAIPASVATPKKPDSNETTPKPKQPNGTLLATKRHPVSNETTPKQQPNDVHIIKGKLESKTINKIYNHSDQKVIRCEKMTNGKPETYKGIRLDKLDPLIDQNLARSFIDHRIHYKAKPTQRGFDAQMNHALEAYKIGWTPNQAIEYVLNETTWQAIYIDWIAKRIGLPMATQAGQARSTREISLEDELNDTSWAKD